jgi:hypothetical protein
MGAEPAHADVRALPVGRAFFADERGVVMRTTWHLDRGFLNLSIWRDNLCVSTFQLAVADTARLVGFLVDGLGEATSVLVGGCEAAAERPVATAPPAPSPPPQPSLADGARDLAAQACSTAGAALGRVEARLRRRP